MPLVMNTTAIIEITGSVRVEELRDALGNLPPNARLKIEQHTPATEGYDDAHSGTPARTLLSIKGNQR